MFSKGQIIFAVVFGIIFTIAIAYTYAKDKKLHSKNYQGVKWVGISFVIFIIILFYIKYLIKNWPKLYTYHKN